MTTSCPCCRFKLGTSLPVLLDQATLSTATHCICAHYHYYFIRSTCCTCSHAMYALRASKNLAARIAHPRGRQQLQVMNFKSAATERMAETGRQYARAWQPSLATAAPEELKSALSNVVSPNGILYRADGVVHPRDRRKGVDELAAHINERYAAYNHVIHDVACMAVDEESRSVFLAVRFIMQNTGPVAGQDATGRLSEGLLLERLELDEDNRITAALVCRPLTLEERDSLTVDPSAVQPGPLPDDLLYANQEMLNPQDLEAMLEKTEAWVQCWDSNSPFLDKLEEILAPEVQQVSGYGLGKRSVPFKGVDGARKAIQGTLGHVENSNKVLSAAICDDRRAGFVLWQADMLVQDKGSPQTTRGLDYLRFDSQNRVSFIYDYTMRPYSNLKDDAPARSDKVE